MYIFAELHLEKIDDKKGGKNKVGGFYKDTKTGKEYFIKQPEDKKELFTELLAGLILKEMLKRSLIDSQYTDSLICADVIQMSDGSYALIQPKIDFELLFKIINTGFRDGSDRNPRLEAADGPAYYMSLLDVKNSFGLSTSLMLSMLLGDYSVHSANMVRLTRNHAGRTIYQYGKIDWGAAFRNYARDENTNNIIYGYESLGSINHKRVTKAYFLNYKYIPGIYEAMKQKAIQLDTRLESESFAEIVYSALKQIPPDLFKQKKPGRQASPDSPKAQRSSDKFELEVQHQLDETDPEEQVILADLSDYTFIESFKTLRLGDESSMRKVAEAFAAVMDNRLQVMKSLQAPEDNFKDKARKLFLKQPTSVHESIFIPHEMGPTIWEEPFPVLVKAFTEWTAKDDFSQIDMTAVVNQLNRYIDFWAQQGELLNLWGNNNPSQNIFSPFADGSLAPKSVRGHAYIYQYREATLMRRMSYSYKFVDEKNPQGVFATHRISPYENPIARYVAANPDSYWALCQNAVTEGQIILNTLQIIQRAQLSSIPPDENTVLGFQKSIKNFLYHNEKLERFLKQMPPQKTNSGQYSSEFFYPIPKQELKMMSADQLATICLEELNAWEVSALLTDIVSDNELYSKVEEALSSGKFMGRADNPATKTAELHKFYLFINTYKQFNLAETYIKKQEDRQIMFEQLKALDTNLKGEAMRLLQEADDHLLSLHQQEIDYEETLEAFNKDPNQSSLELLKSQYAVLPSDIQESKKETLEAAEEGLRQLLLEKTYLLSVKQYEEESTSLNFISLEQCYQELNEIYQSKHQESYKKASSINDRQNLISAYQGKLSAFETENNADNLHALETAFQALSEDDKTVYRPSYEKAVKLMDFKKLYDEALQGESDVKRFLAISAQLLDKYPHLDEAKKEQYKADYDDLVAREKYYTVLLDDQVISQSTPVNEIDPVLEKIFASPDLAGSPWLKEFREHVLQDKRLWDAVKQSLPSLKPHLINDLLILKKFHDERILRNSGNKYGSEYSNSLDRFYEEALKIRLSGQPITDQANAMQEYAKKEFQARHSTRRFIADVVMMLTSLFGGVFVGVGRKLSGKTFFFSTSETQTTREEDFNSLLKDQEEINGDNPDEESLFKKPFSGG